MITRLLVGDCADVMRDMDDSFVDAIVTDPPYGLSKEPDVVEVMRHWLAGDDYKHRGGGFMGKSWDSFVPGPATWREALRVLKPGGHLLCFAGTRTQDLMGISLRLAGFEIRDTITWHYGSGFPKSLDVGKAIDKAAITAPATPEAERWEGWGTALKPASEPIIVARKPLGEKTVAKNVLEHGTGALNIDATRIATGDKLGGGAELVVQSDKPDGWDRPWRNDPDAQAAHAARIRENVQRAEALGRWPANVVLSHAEDCMVVGTAMLKGDPRDTGGGTRPNGFAGVGADSGDSEPNARVYGDAEVEAWACVPGCSVRALDDQTDGASRFFYTAKSSRAEREAGLGGRNQHPTCKPVDLMRYLVRLVAPSDGVVLDPFVGSGTTGIAAALEGFDFVGVEREEEYVELAQVRIDWWGQHGDDSVKAWKDLKSRAAKLQTGFLIGVDPRLLVT